MDKLKQLQKEAQEIFEKYKTLENECKFLRERCQRDFNKHIQIGFVGITSTGKSTLLNVLLGMPDLLPCRARPSTNRLTCCTKAQGNQVVVQAIFENGTQKQCVAHTGNAQLHDFVSQYSDESANPQNQKQVKQICIASPQFAFDESVELYDSPGLDAEGLKIHEEISLGNLLPFLDICIFVTTIKPISDKTVKHFLNIALKEGVELLIVQNQADCVEPKIDGTKSREQVKQDYAKRLENIIYQCDHTGSIPYIQISAKEANDGILNADTALLAHSHVPHFIELVNEMVVQKKKMLAESRLQSICNQIREFCNDQISRLEGNFNVGPFEFKDTEKELKADIAHLNEHFNEMLRRFSVVTKGLLSKRQFDVVINKEAATFLAKFKIIQNKVKGLEKSLGLEKGELFYSFSSPGFSHIDTPVVVIEDAPGRLAKIKRIMGQIFHQDDWGKLKKKRKIFDPQATLRDSQQKYQKAFQDWCNTMQHVAFPKIHFKIKEKYKEYQIRQKQIHHKKEMKALVDDLMQLAGKEAAQPQEQESKNAINKTPKTEEPIKKILLSPLTKGLYELSKMVWALYWQKTIKTLKNQLKAPAENWLVCWGDSDFFSQDFPASKCICPHEPGMWNRLPGYPVSLFVELGVQLGQNERLLADCELDEIVKKRGGKDCVFWVIGQAFNDSEQSLRDVVTFVDQLQHSWRDISLSGVIFWHPNPLYTLVYFHSRKKDFHLKNTQIQFYKFLETHYSALYKGVHKNLNILISEQEMEYE